MSKYVKKASLGSPELNYFQNSFIDFTQFCVHKNGLDFREHHPFHKPLDAICLLSFQATCRNQLECIQLNLMQFPIRSHKLQWNNPLPSPMLIEMLSYNILYSCCQATLPVRMYGRSQLSQTLGQHSLGGQSHISQGHWSQRRCPMLSWASRLNGLVAITMILGRMHLQSSCTLT